MTKKNNDWWVDFFPEFRPYFSKMTPKETNTLVGYIIKKLNLKKGSTFLDCPCGIGRISIPLARKGIKVTGVDITPSYLAELKEKTDKNKLAIRLFHRDMRKIDFENEFDAVGNLWTSFGYFEKESDNMMVLKKNYKALKPGGKFILNILNRDWLVRNFEPIFWSQEKGFKVLENRGFDYLTSASITDWTFIRDGQEKTYTTWIRFYSYHELVGMLHKAGFVDVEGYGGFKGETITHRSRDMNLIATKPKK